MVCRPGPQGGSVKAESFFLHKGVEIVPRQIENEEKRPQQDKKGHSRAYVSRFQAREPMVKARERAEKDQPQEPQIRHHLVRHGQPTVLQRVRIAALKSLWINEILETVRHSISAAPHMVAVELFHPQEQPKLCQIYCYKTETYQVPLSHYASPWGKVRFNHRELPREFLVSYI